LLGFGGPITSGIRSAGFASRSAGKEERRNGVVSLPARRGLQSAGGCGQSNRQRKRPRPTHGFETLRSQSTPRRQPTKASGDESSVPAGAPHSICIRSDRRLPSGPNAAGP
jgi:hypothetical protein